MLKVLPCRFVCIFVLYIFSTAQIAVAEGYVLVTVRKVLASGLFEVKGLQTVNVPVIELDRRISDLQSKLENLHYRQFRLVASYQDVVEIMKKQTMLLELGQRLMVRPLYMRDDKIGLWLRWVDSDGAELLDTRMHFKPGESIVTGVDNSGERGTILAINVSAADADLDKRYSRK